MDNTSVATRESVRIRYKGLSEWQRAYVAYTLLPRDPANGLDSIMVLVLNATPFAVFRSGPRLYDCTRRFIEVER